MANEQEVIIVDDRGREHIFPPGMDPKRAAQSVKNTLLQEANAKPLKEPTTFRGGFLKGLNSEAEGMGRAGLEGMAHPQSAGDFLSLMLPGSRIPGLRATAAVPGTTEAIGNTALRAGARGAANAVDFIPTIARSKGEARVTDWLREKGAPPAKFSELPLVKQEPHLPSTPGPQRKLAPPPPQAEAPPFHERPLYQQMEDMPETPAPVDPRGGGPIASGQEDVRRSPSDVRITGKAPSLEEVLNEALTQEMGGGSGATATLSPEPGITPGGPLHQSGKFGKSGSLGQPGGYSSGTPGVSSTRYDEIVGKVGGEGPLAPEPAIPQGPAGGGPADLMDPATIAEERRMYGSVGAGQRLEMSAEDVKALAPGPSRTSLMGEQAIQDARGRAAMGTTDRFDTKSGLEELLRKIIESGGKP